MTDYDPKIWFQVSRRFRTLARLPEGKTGKDCMREEREAGRAFFATERWIQGVGEGTCGDHWLRCLAPSTLTVTLSLEDFQAWKAAGGTTYEYHYFNFQRARWTSLANAVLSKHPSWEDRIFLHGSRATIAHRTQPSHWGENWLVSYRGDVLLLAYPDGLWQQFQVVEGESVPRLIQCGWATSLETAVEAAEQQKVEVAA